MRLVDHALAQREVGVGQVGEGLQQDLGGDSGLEESWVELVPRKRNKDTVVVCEGKEGKCKAMDTEELQSYDYIYVKFKAGKHELG